MTLASLFRALCTLSLSLLTVASYAAESNFVYGAPVTGFSLAAKMEKTTFKRGEPVVVIVRIKNVSAAKAELTIGEDDRQYLFALTSSTGKKVLKLAYQRQLEANREHVLKAVGTSFKPGEFREYKFDLSIRYDLFSPGQYLVQCRREVNQRDDSGKITFAYIFSAPIEFTIVR